MLEDYNPIFGKNVIETLSEGMYDNPLFLFREYVQNSADAIDAAEKCGILKSGEGEIIININGNEREISFVDNGTGITKDNVARMLANVGDSQKDRKLNKGFRGIGRLGGLGYCRKVRFETSSKDENIKTILEWDAKLLHEILADKDVHINASDLIRKITTIKYVPCENSSHFFSVTMIGINDNNSELLNEDEVRRYLSMVAPVPFDYVKFMFKEEISKFLLEKNLPEPQTYNLFLNGNQIFKGYESPLKIDGNKDIEILGVECHPIKSEDRILGWYWFCITSYDGVLPQKCWQRCIRLRKSNIQIGEADCISNHSKRGISLWREERSNNYFIGEVHALDDDLIPNSRRDYFNQDDACRRFEAALTEEFEGLYDLYRYASVLRNKNKTISSANQAEKEFIDKEQSGGFYNNQDRETEKEKLEKLKSQVPAAQKAIDHIRKKSETNPALDKIVKKFDSVMVSTPLSNNKIDLIENKKQGPKKGFIKDKLSRDERRVLRKVFEVIDSLLPEDNAKLIHDAILKKFS